MERVAVERARECVRARVTRVERDATRAVSTATATATATRAR